MDVHTTTEEDMDGNIHRDEELKQTETTREKGGKRIMEENQVSSRVGRPNLDIANVP